MFQDSYQPGFLLDFSARVVHTARGESGVLCRLVSEIGERDVRRDVHTAERFPPVDCKRTAAAAGPSSRLAQSDRFVRLLSAPLVELPDMRHGSCATVCVLADAVGERDKPHKVSKKVVYIS